MQEMQCCFVKTNQYNQIWDGRTRLERAASFCRTESSNSWGHAGSGVFLCEFPVLWIPDGKIGIFLIDGCCRCFPLSCRFVMGCDQLFIPSPERVCPFKVWTHLR